MSPTTAMEGLAALERRASCEGLDPRAWAHRAAQWTVPGCGDAHGALARARHGTTRLCWTACRWASGTIPPPTCRRAGRSRDFPGRQMRTRPWSARRARWVSMCWAEIRYRVTQSCCPDRRNPHDLTRTPAASSAGSAPPWPISWRRCLLARRRPDPCAIRLRRGRLQAHAGRHSLRRHTALLAPAGRDRPDRAFRGGCRAIHACFHRGSPLRPAIALRDVSASACGAQALGRHGARHARGLRRSSQVAIARGRAGDGAVHAVRVRGDGRSAGRDHGLRPGREYAMLKRDHAALCDPGLIEYPTMGEASRHPSTPPRWTRRTPAVARSMMSRATWTRWPCHPRWARRRLPAAPAVLLSSASGPCCTTRRSPCRRRRGPTALPLGFQLVGFVKEDPRLLYWARCVERILGSTAHRA